MLLQADLSHLPPSRVVSTLVCLSSLTLVHCGPRHEARWGRGLRSLRQAGMAPTKIVGSCTNTQTRKVRRSKIALLAFQSLLFLVGISWTLANLHSLRTDSIFRNDHEPQGTRTIHEMGDKKAGETIRSEEGWGMGSQRWGGGQRATLVVPRGGEPPKSLLHKGLPADSKILTFLS